MSAKYYGRPPRDVRASRGAARAQGRGCRHHRHARALALTRPQARGRGGQGRVLREADGQRARGGARRRATRSSRRKRVVQIGTQHRSEAYPRAAQASSASGVLGDVSKIEVVWNYHGPRWRGRPEVQQIREQDTDWRAWLMTKPDRPFDPRRYFEFRLYRDFSSGIPDQWMSHGIDLVHWFMDDPFPTLRGRARWRLRLEGRPREPRHLPGAARIPEGLPRQLLDELRQRRARASRATWARTPRS